MAFHVFKLAMEEGVRRVIVTSSNQPWIGMRRSYIAGS
jgi:hypothetical protein